MHDAVGAFIEAIFEGLSGGESPRGAGRGFLFVWLGLLAVGVAIFVALFIFG